MMRPGWEPSTWGDGTPTNDSVKLDPTGYGTDLHETKQVPRAPYKQGSQPTHDALVALHLRGGQFDAYVGLGGYKTQYRAQVASESMGKRMKEVSRSARPDGERFEQRITKGLSRKTSVIGREM